MIGSYFIEDCSLFIDDRLMNGTIYYLVCYRSNDFLDGGILKRFKYRKAAENYIKRLRKNE